MSPEQKIRIRTRVLLEDIGYPVYNYLPNGERGFPMIHLGEQFKQNERLHVDGLNGSTQLTIHVWHNDINQEGTVMGIVHQIERMFLNEYGLKGEDISTEITVDDSTDSRLLHGIIIANVNY